MIEVNISLRSRKIKFSIDTEMDLEDVWGDGTHEGMIVAREGSLCPIWGDTLPTKAVTVLCLPDQEKEVVLFLEEIQKRGTVSQRIICSNNGITMIAIRSVHDSIDVLKEIKFLEDNGVYINLTHEFYKKGSNCVWSINFRKFEGHYTSTYNDNHEHGDNASVLKIAILFAKYLLEKEIDRTIFFDSPTENVTEEGNKKWKRYYEARDRINMALGVITDSVIPHGKKPKTWFEMTFDEKVEHCIEETHDFCRCVKCLGESCDHCKPA